ncbi:hypothetical protein L9F63_014948, partial [Diploptera punctata]
NRTQVIQIDRKMHHRRELNPRFSTLRTGIQPASFSFGYLKISQQRIGVPDVVICGTSFVPYRRQSFR